MSAPITEPVEHEIDPAEETGGFLFGGDPDPLDGLDWDGSRPPGPPLRVTVRDINAPNDPAFGFSDASGITKEPAT